MVACRRTPSQTCSPHGCPRNATAPYPSATADTPPDTTPPPTPASEGRCGPSSFPPRISPSPLHWSVGLHLPLPPPPTLPHPTPPQTPTPHPLGPVRGWKGATQWGAGPEGTPPRPPLSKDGRSWAMQPPHPLSLPRGDKTPTPSSPPSEEHTGSPEGSEVWG